MLHETTKKQYLSLCQQSSRVVVSREIYADLLTPVGVFRALAARQKDAALLDSSDHKRADDACVYLGFDPVAEFQAVQHDVTVTVDGKAQTTRYENPFNALREFYNTYKAASVYNLAKFAGGMIGFMSYDAVRFIERLPDQHENEQAIPELCFKFYGTNVAFDKRSGKALITRVVNVSDDPEAQYEQVMQEITLLIDKMLNHQEKINAVLPSNQDEVPVTSDLSDDEFAAMVEKAKAYIAKGDAFQIVTSRRFQRPYSGDDFDLYRALRVLNPSPYQFYLRYSGYSLVGASPERLVSLQNGIVETMPIAGTRPRGKTKAEDIALEKELLANEKEIAEHMMLVDLGRNDLGRISIPGSVNLSDFKSISRFSRVMHIVSRVEGRLQEGKDAFDVLQAVFPAGTLSGAPKIRAMEIIDELETSRRGAYGGAIVAIDNTGQFDSCITIRTALLKDGVATVRAGGGVVLDSDPHAEAQETRHKAQAVLDALVLAEGGLV